jgi:hypothetical protein
MRTDFKARRTRISAPRFIAGLILAEPLNKSKRAAVVLTSVRQTSVIIKSGFVCRQVV